MGFFFVWFMYKDLIDWGRKKILELIVQQVLIQIRRNLGDLKQIRVMGVFIILKVGSRTGELVIEKHRLEGKPQLYMI